jgi:hypothetical protein
MTDALSTESLMFGGDWSALAVTGLAWGKKSDEWVLHVAMGQHHPPLESLSDDALKQVIRATLNIPDLELRHIDC